MAAPPLTASAIISFSQGLENQTEAFYSQLAVRFSEHATSFERYAQECAKSRTLITRTYQETISDALEAGFAFEAVRLADHDLDWSLPEDTELPAAIDLAMRLEGRAIAFYEAVAQSSESLLATIPRAFRRAAKTRERRRSKLQGLAA